MPPSPATAARAAATADAPNAVSPSSGAVRMRRASTSESSTASPSARKSSDHSSPGTPPVVSTPTARIAAALIAPRPDMRSMKCPSCTPPADRWEKRSAKHAGTMPSVPASSWGGRSMLAQPGTSPTVAIRHGSHAAVQAARRSSASTSSSHVGKSSSVWQGRKTVRREIAMRTSVACALPHPERRRPVRFDTPPRPFVRCL